MNDQDRDTSEAIFGELLYSYTRADAIRDGVLADITERAKRTGIHSRRYEATAILGVRHASCGNHVGVAAARQVTIPLPRRRADEPPGQLRSGAFRSRPSARRR